MFSALRKYSLFFIGIVSLTSLSSCSVFQSPSSKTTKVRYTIDATATVMPARYDANYLLEGNIVARYENFDFVRIASETVPANHPSKMAGCYSTFEIRKHDGTPLKRLLLSPKNGKRLLRFRVNGKSYLIQNGSAEGSYILSRPSHFFA